MSSGVSLISRRLHDLAELREAGGADDRRGDAARDQPGQRDLRRHRVVARRHRVERLQNAQAARVEIFLEPSAARRVLVGVGQRAVFAGEEAGGERSNR